jgi:hypothetical protein
MSNPAPPNPVSGPQSPRPTPSPPPGNTPLFRALEPYLSPARLGPYLQATGGHQKRALALYQWNVGLSGAVHEALNVFEVVLRNALDRQLKTWNATQVNRATGLAFGPEWTLGPANLLSRLVGSDLVAAQNRATKAVGHRRAIRHEDVVAQLMFGTWRFLLPDNDPGRQLLWSQALVSAFPHLTRPPADLVSAVSGNYRLRNRVAHFEPLLKPVEVLNQYENVRDVLAEIDPDVSAWFVSIQRVTPVAKSRPK